MSVLDKIIQLRDHFKAKSPILNNYFVTARQKQLDEPAAHYRPILMEVAQTIKNSGILERTGGELIIDGSGFGIADDQNKRKDFLFVKTTNEGIQEIRKLSGVTGIHADAQMTAPAPKFH